MISKSFFVRPLKFRFVGCRLIYNLNKNGRSSRGEEAADEEEEEEKEEG